MSLRHRFTTLFAKTFGKPRIIQVRNKQKTLQTIPNIILPTSNSPTRMEIPLEMIELFEKRKDIEMRQILPIRSLLSIFKTIHLSVDSIKDNPSTLKREVSQEFLENMKEYARLQGVGHIGYVKLSRDLIFQELGVLYENALILTMEMSKDMIDKAPSQATLNMVFGTYDDLGIAVNKIAGFLRDHGYSAQADHPFGGLSLFPPLAQMAGLGQVGKHGLLITPEFGPRVRLAAVYTNIDNLPFGEGNDHGWIVDYVLGYVRPKLYLMNQ